MLLGQTAFYAAGGCCIRRDYLKPVGFIVDFIPVLSWIIGRLALGLLATIVGFSRPLMVGCHSAR